MVKKVNKEEWAKLIEQGIRKNELERKKRKRREEREELERLRKYISVPILIGLVTIGVYLWLFHWTWMVKGLLNAIIAATLVATFMAYVKK